MDNIVRQESARKRGNNAPSTKAQAWRSRIYSRASQPAVDPQALYELLTADALCRRSPLNFRQRLAVHELATRIAHGTADSVDVTQLARACSLSSEKTRETVDLAPGFFVRRGRDVWLVHPAMRATGGRP